MNNLLDYTLEELKVWMKENGENKPISETQAYRIMKEIEKEFKLQNIGNHSTRKTFAYWLYIDNKKDIGLVQKALGYNL